MSEITFNTPSSILSHFQDLADPRSHINRRHIFGDLLVICIMAVIAGADGPCAIGTWAETNKEWLKKYLPLPSGIPSHDTLGRILSALKPLAFQACFQSWIQEIAPVGEAGDLNQIAIDGKVLRRSHDRKNELGPLWLVSAWAVDRGVSLGQQSREEMEVLFMLLAERNNAIVLIKVKNFRWSRRARVRSLRNFSSSANSLATINGFSRRCAFW